MTAVVGLVEDSGKVWVGADSAASDEMGSLDLRAAAKVFKKGGVVIGGCGSFRAIQLVRYKLSVQEHKRGTVEKWMACTFIEALRKCLMDGGHTTKKDNEELAEGVFLVGHKGHLFTVWGDFQYGESINEYAAVGSGAEVALGAMFARKHGGPRARILTALKAASTFRVDVRPPFRVESA